MAKIKALNTRPVSESILGSVWAWFTQPTGALVFATVASLTLIVMVRNFNSGSQRLVESILLDKDEPTDEHLIEERLKLLDQIGEDSPENSTDNSEELDDEDWFN